MDSMSLHASSNASTPRADKPVRISTSQRLLRSGMRVLGAIHPPSAAAVMKRLWFSAPRLRPRASEQAVLESATRLSFDVHGRRVAAWAWDNQGPAILLLHGWGGYAGHWQAFVEPLHAAGFRVVAFDAPAHGASDASRHGGRQVTFFEFADALATVAAAETSVAGIVAHSGGCTALSLALRAGWQAPANIVFIAPFAQPFAAVDGFARAIGANERVVAAFSTDVQRWLGHPWSYLDIATLEDTHKWRRLLVIHDEDDRDVPLSQARAVAASWPASQLMVTRGLGHRRLLREPLVIGKTLEFLGAAASDAPHGGNAYLPRDSRAALDAAYEGYLTCASGGRHR
ncbi:Alpha/beta hydrolase family protein [Dyella jiangningensis]|uniref:alpha/beta fold hydrolase n=1 Tax=Dyella sp. AtDHG13 TaxID=1938897 RepID=UPI00088A55AB|nr:alpha/beta fold hydrolase [Dyella sp. AtDHG13]PXV58970.1 serine aminopeptidase S33 family [Dyella sp. AtDHG13]SDL31435.1 Alpha/beta hydrolase family protein [Dyella jiangningensis]